MKQMYFNGSCLLFLLVLVAGCTEGKKTHEIAQSVEVIYPKPTHETKIRVLSGIVKENSTLNLAFETAGRIEAIQVKEGDYVKAGQVIARLNKEDYELSVKALQTQRDLAYREAARKKRMFEQKALSGNEYETARTTLENLDAQLEIQKNKYEYTTLKAPVSGCIQKVNMHKGEWAGVGSCIATLLDVSKMEVEVGLPSELYHKRDLFGQVTCFLSRTPEKIYPLDQMKAVVKSDGNQLYKVVFRIQDTEMNEITAGMNVQVNIPLKDDSQDASQLLPSSSVCKDATGSPYIYVVTLENTLNKTEISVLGIEGNEICVRGELPAGSKVVKAGVSSLQEGQKVKIIQTSSPTNKGDLI